MAESRLAGTWWRSMRPQGPGLAVKAAVVERGRQGSTPPIRLLRAVLTFLERLSLGNFISGPFRRRALRLACSGDEVIVWRYYAACVLDCYIAVCVLVEIVFLTVGRNLAHWLVVPATGYRLAEVVVVLADAVLLDRSRSLGRGVRTYMVVSVTRSIVQSATLFGETLLCFAILFYVERFHFGTGIASTQDALDASIRTMVTVGTDATAEGWFRLFVDLEPIIGVFFFATVVSRLIGASPAFSDISQNPGDAEQDAALSKDSALP